MAGEWEAIISGGVIPDEVYIDTHQVDDIVYVNIAVRLPPPNEPIVLTVVKHVTPEKSGEHEDHDKCCHYLHCAHPKCCGYRG